MDGSQTRPLEAQSVLSPWRGGVLCWAVPLEKVLHGAQRVQSAGWRKGFQEEVPLPPGCVTFTWGHLGDNEGEEAGQRTPGSFGFWLQQLILATDKVMERIGKADQRASLL